MSCDTRAETLTGISFDFVEEQSYEQPGAWFALDYFLDFWETNKKREEMIPFKKLIQLKLVEWKCSHQKCIYSSSQMGKTRNSLKNENKDLN